jgi:hypothetical protein
VAQIGVDEAQIGKPSLVTLNPDSQSVSRADLSLLPYASCMGEVISSFRQLAKRFSLVGKVALGTTLPSTAFAPGSSCNGFVIYPWAPVIPTNGPIVVSPAGAMTPTYYNQYRFGVASSFTDIYQTDDIYSQLYSMFAFFRGSIRYKITITRPGTAYNPALPIQIYINNVVNPNVGNWTPPMQIGPAINSGPSNNLGTGPIQPLFDLPPTTAGILKNGFAYQPNLASNCTVVYPDKEGNIEFEVPFHASGPFCPTNYGQNNPTNTRSIFNPFPIVTIVGASRFAGQNASLPGTNFDVYRAVGDDFSFGGLLGSPATALWQSALDPT